MQMSMAIFNYMLIFLLALALYVVSIIKFLANKTEWVLIAFSLMIMFLSLWGALNIKKFCLN